MLRSTLHVVGVHISLFCANCIAIVNATSYCFLSRWKQTDLIHVWPK